MSGIAPAASRTMDVGAMIDAGEVSPLQRSVFVLCCLVAVLDGLDTFSIGIAWLHAPAG